jgi:hypothetical protein
MVGIHDGLTGLSRSPTPRVDEIASIVAKLLTSQFNGRATSLCRITAGRLSPLVADTLAFLKVSLLWHDSLSASSAVTERCRGTIPTLSPAPVQPPTRAEQRHHH